VLEAVLADVRDLVAVVDPDGRIRFVNAALTRVLGWEVERWTGRDVRGLVHPEDLSLVEDVAGPVEVRLARADGSWCRVEIVATDHLDDPRIAGWVLVGRAVPAERAGALAYEAEACEQDRRRFEQVFEHAPVGMALVDREGHFERVNGAYLRSHGHTTADLVGRHVMSLVAEEDLGRAMRYGADALAGLDPEPVEVRYRTADDDVRWARVSVTVVRGDDGAVRHSILMAEDVTEEHVLREQLLYAATHDDLTGLLNRPGFEGVCQTAVERARGGGEVRPVALLLIDLDGFKRVNDQFGHPAGDTLLELVAGRIRRSVRTTDAVARVGGDEFLVLLDPVVSAEDAADLAERIRSRLQTPFELAGGVARISASIGLTVTDRRADLTGFLERVDEAAYAVKAGGGDGVEVATDAPTPAPGL
jgi:diguanylate cyclase (GGDEF)-like protein/PAS domain S-box-containing protein